MSDTKYCPICGTENKAIDKFCENCGTSLDVQEMPAKPVYKSETPQYQQPTQEPIQAPSYQQPVQQPGYQQPIYGNLPQGTDPTIQYMMLKKDKVGPFLLSCFCFGIGMLTVDSERYIVKFIIALILWPFFIGWILSIVWTLEAVDQYNRDLVYQTGIQPVGYL